MLGILSGSGEWRDGWRGVASVGGWRRVVSGCELVAGVVCAHGVAGGVARGLGVEIRGCKCDGS